jgi:hypothetical protein
MARLTLQSLSLPPSPCASDPMVPLLPPVRVPRFSGCCESSSSDDEYAIAETGGGGGEWERAR